ncbi:MAG TPA: site-2 protease family protein [Syntrophorhabdaceae bacterium]|nr:site-2 protease family protein [Syntrophorhabdaceae bacterium]
MGLIQSLFTDPLSFVLFAIPLLYSIIFHELAHGLVAYKMGDPTAKWLGRLSLDPRRHLDPIGTVALFLVGFGWAKPVPVNFANLRPQRLGLILVSAAGITANLILAFFSFFAMQFAPPYLFEGLSNMGRINIMLASFNLIPIPPLDGSKILMGFSTRRFQYTLQQIEPYGMFILIGLLLIGALNRPIILIETVLAHIIRFLVS